MFTTLRMIICSLMKRFDANGGRGMGGRAGVGVGHGSDEFPGGKGRMSGVFNAM